MKNFLFILFVIGCAAGAWSQNAYFVDGYHGGVFGHYPTWVTRFMMDKLTQHPEWRIMLEIEPETWDSVRINDPQTYEAFQRYISDPRIEFTNPSFAQPFLYNVSGESIIRQFEYGIRKIREHFPGVAFTTYSAEEPCFTSCLPQILKSLGFKFAVLKNPDTCWGGYTSAYGGETVVWKGPDGTTITTVPRYASEAFEKNSTWQTKAWNNSKEFLQACWDYGIINPVGMCYQDAGWKNGPWLGHGDSIKNKSVYVTWKEYFETITNPSTTDIWRFSQEDMLVSLMWGSQVLQRIAQQVRQAENKLIIAEKIHSMALISNRLAFPQTMFDSAWRALMLAQHHDSWIVPYNRLSGRKTWADAIREWTSYSDSLSGVIIVESAHNLNNTNVSNKNSLGYVQVFNATGNARYGNVTIELPDDLNNEQVSLYDDKNRLALSFRDGKQLTFKAAAPSFGYSVYRIEEAIRQLPASKGITITNTGDCVMENETYRIVFDADRGGSIKSLVDKKADKRELINPNDNFAFGEIRGFFYEDEKFYSSVEQPARISIIHDNAVEKKIQIEGFIDKHPFTQTVTLSDSQPTIDFALKIHWVGNPGIGEYRQGDNWRDNRRAFYDDRYKLSILFPANLSSPALFKNAPFDVCESRIDNTFFNTWDSIKHNIILHWVDLFDRKNNYGMALLSDHTTSYSFGEGYPLGLTAQYAGRGLWGMNYAITQELEMRYALIPHSGQWNEASIADAGSYWNEPLTGVFSKEGKPEQKSFFTINQRGYEITSVRAEGDEVVLRLYNSEENKNPLKVKIHFPAKRMEEILLNGDVVSAIPLIHIAGQSEATLRIPPYGIRTYRLYLN